MTSPKQKKLLGSYVEDILKAKDHDLHFETNEFEQKIDEMVYKLYELTYEEVKVIESEFGLSEEEKK